MRTPAFFGFLLVVAAGCGPDYKLDQARSRIVVSPGLADFGAVAVDQEASADLTLTHVAGGAVQVVAIDILDIEGSFFSVDDALPLVPTDSDATLPVHYHPTESGFHLAQLTIVTDEDEDNEHVVDLRGAAGQPSAQVWPVVLDFGPVASGSSTTGVVTVENDGGVDLSVLSAALDTGPFSVESAVPADVEAGTEAAFTVRFAPTDDTAATASLTFGLDGGVSVSPVSLRGNACETGAAALYDTDADGWTACAADCDESDATVHPGAAEVCDGVDQDCDGVTDEGTSCADDDGDGVTEDAGDCNDGDAGVSPAAAEIYSNGVDDDCDGTIDYGTVDDDGDGYAAEGGDCDLADTTVYPGAPELLDGVDNDCDGTTDEGTTAYDDDGDGVTEAAGDCDDSDAAVYPAAAETADGVDDDCDGNVDEGTTSGDDDRDGYTESGGDCDDTDAAINPGEPDTLGNSTDDNCDGITE